jgi:hypothetical protein
MRLRLLLSLVIAHCSLVISPAAPLDPAKYPQAAELVLATLPADVQPIRSVRVKSPTDGLLTLNLPPAGTRLSEGTVWGEFDPERLKLEGEAVALARAFFEEKDRAKLDLDLARASAELAERRAELLRQTDMLARIASDPTLADLYASETTGAASGEELATLAARLRAQLVLIDEVLRYAGTPRENELERRALELKLQAQELDFARRLQEFRLVMPFDGELALVPPPPPAGKPLRVPLGADLAILRDFSVIQAGVPVRRPEWRLLDTTRLLLRHSPAFRRPLDADYERSVLREQNGREELFYIFRFPDAQRDAARPLAGGQVAMQLVLRLDETARIIPKIDLILAAPAAFRDHGWEAGVAAALPGARLLALGETHLAVVVP